MSPGTISSRRPPTSIPRSPLSHPGLASSSPRWNENRRLSYSQVDSNGCPSILTATNWVSRRSPLFASTPQPGLRSSTTRSSGGPPPGRGGISNSLRAPAIVVVLFGSCLASSSGEELPQPVPTTAAQSRIRKASGARRSMRAEQVWRGNPDYLSLEPLFGSVDHPGGVDFPDLQVEAKLVGMPLQVLQVRQPRVVAPFQQLLRHNRLGDDIDDLLPVVAVDVAGRGRHQAERSRPLHAATREDSQCLGGIDEGIDDEDLRPVPLRDLVHLGVSAALDEVSALLAPYPLEPVEEVGDVLDLEVLDPLEVEVLPHRPLVAGALRAQRHYVDLALSSPRLHRR